MVIAGDEKGRQGKVLRVLPKENRVVVEGINVHTKHQRPTQANQQGGITEKELPIHASNVQPVVDGRSSAAGRKNNRFVPPAETLGQ